MKQEIRQMLWKPPRHKFALSKLRSLQIETHTTHYEIHEENNLSRIEWKWWQSEIFLFISCANLAVNLTKAGNSDEKIIAYCCFDINRGARKEQIIQIIHFFYSTKNFKRKNFISRYWQGHKTKSFHAIHPSVTISLWQQAVLSAI